MTFNIYVTGVGGQGIGLLSEVLLRAMDTAGMPPIGVDTHGLAQRGGIVASHIRAGDGVHAPLVPVGQADLAVALERHEALRALDYLREKGTLVYYDAVWQPLPVRMRHAPAVSLDDISRECERRHIRNVRVFRENLPDPRMQNVAVLASIIQNRLIPGLTAGHVETAMADLMDGSHLSRNVELFRTGGSVQ